MDNNDAIAPGDTLTRKCWRTYAISLAKGAGLMTGAILATAVFVGPPKGRKAQKPPTDT